MRRQYAKVRAFVWWLFVETEIRKAFFFEKIDNYRMRRKST
jgi:hypothetical protein